MKGNASASRRSLRPKDHAPAAFDPKADAPRVSKVVLFDIDGTLVLTGGAGVRAMTRAFEELFAVRDAFKRIPMPGRTDAGILAQAAIVHGIAPEKLAAFHDVYLGHLRRELHEPGARKGVMPGIRPLLDVLADD